MHSTTLPVHATLLDPVTGEPLRALAVLPSGRIVWPIYGGADDDADKDDTADKDDDQDGGEDDDADKDDTADKDDDKPLGPAGEKAYQAEKAKRRAAQAQLREWRELGKTPAEIKKLLEGKPADGKAKDTPDVDEIKAEVRREVDREVQRERILDKIEAKAAKGFADPDDAAALVMVGRDPEDFLDGDGKVDAEAIEDALKELLKKKPYLAADAAQGGKRFGGGADGGARKDSRPNQLTRDQLKRMSPQEIVKAKAEGRLDDALAGKG